MLLSAKNADASIYSVLGPLQLMSGIGGKQTRALIRHSREGGNPAKQKIMREDFQPAVYLLASARNGTLYVGVTSNLIARIHQHRSGAVAGFTRDYAVKQLVWWEQHGTMESAITREKRIKKWNRAWKLNLIEADNPDWRDLAEEFGFAPLS